MSNFAFYKMKIQFITPENGETETDPVVGGAISSLPLFLMYSFRISFREIKMQ